LVTGIVLLAFGSISFSTTWYVPPIPSIQSGIDSCVANDSVLVASGAYYENINFNGKAISVVSISGYGSTIIDGDNAGNVITFNHGEGQGSLISGFTITHGNLYGVYLSSSAPKIENCLFTDNQQYPINSIHPQYVESIVDSATGHNIFMQRTDNRFNAFVIRAGTISQSTIWPVPPEGFTYLVAEDNDIHVSGPLNPVLHLLPGTIIKLLDQSELAIGYYDNAKLEATGVTFTSAYDDTVGDALGDSRVPSPGDWRGIRFWPSSDSTSVIAECIIRYAGYGDGAFCMYSSSAIVINSFFDDNDYCGLYVDSEDGGRHVSWNTFSNNGWPVLIHPGSVDSIVANNTFVPNVDGRRNVITLMGGRITKSTIWPVPPEGFTYLVAEDNDIHVSGPLNPVLHLQPGTVIKLLDQSELTIGYYDEGKLEAEGVTFTSAYDDTVGDALGDSRVPSPGDWRGIRFWPSSDSTSMIADCIIRYAGYGDGTLCLYSSFPNIVSNSFDQNDFCALYVDTEGAGRHVRWNTFSNNGWPVVIHPGAVDSVVANNTFIPNPSGNRNAVVLTSGVISQSTTWPVPPEGFTYLVLSGASDIHVGGTQNPGLTLLPGTVIKLLGQRELSVGYYDSGKLEADGVTFTSAYDDTMGDALDDAAVPSPGDWRGIRFWQNSDSTSVLENCLIRYAGYGDGALCLYSTANIIYSRFKLNAGRAVLCSGTNARPSIFCNEIADNSIGIFCQSAAAPRVHYNAIVNNTLYGVQNIYAGLTVDAENNWWGDQTGPYHPTLNLPGLGNPVSDYVDFDPWMESPPGGGAYVTWLYPGPADLLFDTGKPKCLKWVAHEAGLANQQVLFHYQTPRGAITIPITDTYECEAEVPQVVIWPASNIWGDDCFLEVNLYDDQNALLASGRTLHFEARPYTKLVTSTLWGNTLVFNVFVDGTHLGQSWKPLERLYINNAINDALLWLETQWRETVDSYPEEQRGPDLGLYLKSVSVEDIDYESDSKHNQIFGQLFDNAIPHHEFESGTSILKFAYPYDDLPYSIWDNVVLLFHWKKTLQKPYTLSPCVNSETVFLDRPPVFSEFGERYSDIQIPKLEFPYRFSNPVEIIVETAPAIYAHEILHQFYALDEYCHSGTDCPCDCEFVWRNPFLNLFDHPDESNNPGYENENCLCCSPSPDRRSIMTAGGRLLSLDEYHLSSPTKGWIGLGLDETESVWDVMRNNRGSIGGIVVGNGVPLGSVPIQLFKGSSLLVQDNRSCPTTGAFAFRDLERGNYLITAFVDDQLPISKEVKVRAGRESKVVIEIPPIIFEKTAISETLPPKVLIHSWPNPFNSRVSIQCEIPIAGEAKVSIFNILGQEVVVLIDGHVNAGRHDIQWNASEVPSGIYFAIVGTGNTTKASKLILVK